VALFTELLLIVGGCITDPEMNDVDEFEDGIDYSSINLAQISPSKCSNRPKSDNLLSNHQCQQRRSPGGGPHGEQHSLARLPVASGVHNVASQQGYTHQRGDQILGGGMITRAYSGQALSGRPLQDTEPVVPESVNYESAAELRRQVSYEHKNV